MGGYVKKGVRGKMHNEKIHILFSITKYQKNFDRMLRQIMAQKINVMNTNIHKFTAEYL